MMNAAVLGQGVLAIVLHDLLKVEGLFIAQRGYMGHWEKFMLCCGRNRCFDVVSL